MKKLISVFLALIAVFSSIPSLTAFASNGTEDDAYFTQEYFESLEHVYVYADSMQPQSTGLIIDKNLGIAKNGSNLIIMGYTEGSSEVTKCGFTKVVIERKTASASSWSKYITYNDLYSSSNNYNLSKSVTVQSGYQYRVAAIHYAKKSLFSTQKIEVTTGYLTF